MSTVTARISDDALEKLNQLAKVTKRSKSFLVAEALDGYLAMQAWQVSEIEKSLAQAEKGEFASDKEVRDEFAKWGVRLD